ncbi:zinc finger protein [Fistulifera solaris]|uniref:Zinc finger protein n=1 Tax=Fistulifera solaris TaxID=1519565 RepID=A0A1Z5JAL4_FISSO|nr:zinc finger protein [Fistulifera solaris]|eukprot:GAX11043.1 zinc finger protein [Fistulifera solaris]
MNNNHKDKQECVTLPQSTMSHKECEPSIVKDCYCPACRSGKATTTILLTKVPYFRELIIMNLCCEVCGYRNAQVSFGGSIQDKGQRITLIVRSFEDLNRQIVKSDSATLFFPTLDFEIPPSTQPGKISTLEGILQTTVHHLTQQQAERLLSGDVDNFHRCRAVIDTIQRWISRSETVSENETPGTDNTSEFPFDVILDDPAGNSDIENFQAPHRDPQLTHTPYRRTLQQDAVLGLQPPFDTKNNADHTNSKALRYTMYACGDERSELTEKCVPKDEIMRFPTICPSCRCPAESNMCSTDIPHFQSVILMCMLCSTCGYRSNDIQGNGGAISERGTRIILNVTDMVDLSRDVLTSTTATINIPEFELEVGGSSLGGVYSTVEGILTKIVEHLETTNPFATGDSAIKRTGDSARQEDELSNRFNDFLNMMKEVIRGQHFSFQLILTDPLSNSFVGPRPGNTVLLANERVGSQIRDDNLFLEEYERSHAENEVLGLNDIMTGNNQLMP